MLALLIAFFVCSYCIASVNGLKLQPFAKTWKNRIQKSIASSLLLVSFLPAAVNADQLSLQNQLQQLQVQQLADAKTRVQTAEADLMTQELSYPEGKLVGRAVVTLAPLNADLRQFPYGLSDATEIDPRFGNDDASLFVLAVGREGPPLAAKRVLLKGLEFPYTFELTTDALLFPYTTDAWKASPNSLDSIGITVIISPSGKLAAPVGAERAGFSLSDPTVIAGRPGRTTANILINSVVDGKLYTDEEKALLDSVDKQFDKTK